MNTITNTRTSLTRETFRSVYIKTLKLKMIAHLLGYTVHQRVVGYRENTFNEYLLNFDCEDSNKVYVSIRNNNHPRYDELAELIVIASTFLTTDPEESGKQISDMVFIYTVSEGKLFRILKNAAKHKLTK